MSLVSKGNNFFCGECDCVTLVLAVTPATLNTAKLEWKSFPEEGSGGDPILAGQPDYSGCFPKTFPLPNFPFCQISLGKKTMGSDLSLKLQDFEAESRDLVQQLKAINKV
jgi:hypothetical protein